MACEVWMMSFIRWLVEARVALKTKRHANCSCLSSVLVTQKSNQDSNNDNHVLSYSSPMTHLMVGRIRAITWIVDTGWVYIYVRPKHDRLQGVSERWMPVSEHGLISLCQSVITSTGRSLLVLHAAVYQQWRGNDQRQTQHTNVDGVTSDETRTIQC